ncbi:MAG TPA: acyl-CoA dehydrogenase [Rhodospirillales bacterium]|nr:acyl-CoA dehydrogenase [Alphaproteobacteria bacterium]HIA81843.1 acyl-CoA dehydrogenase [Rhodospirillales bacterium]HIN92101.1 acyl-CoA dehydrogenase [Alphaproteobacteria bacterium]HIP08410.1 acyl-CoA dehydrogenase [Rhodospirillales bacterium]
MTTASLILIIVIAGLIALFVTPVLRRLLISAPIMKMVGRALPTMGETERIALEAGTVWWDGDLFSGKPDWQKLLEFEIKPLTEEEQAFLDGPTQKLCVMLDDWEINQKRDLPSEVWDFIKNNGFFGMIIPRRYGGLEFSAHLHSAVVTKLSSRSVVAAVTVMVPNSLGPGELLLHYGTEKQKDHYLPRLASGQDIPCFALTEPGAGSDAANGQSRGIVCKGMWDNEEIIGIRLTFNKRYITLAPVAGIVGLAFRLEDPDHMLGEVEDIGITCALLPRETPGMIIGSRHDPMGVPFQNGPISGEDVFVPLDYIIGGTDGAGNGWRMLMESLAAGRSISLPSQSLGAAELATRATSAYASVREQFGMPIAKFEGIRERLARIAGHTYFMNAARRLAFGAVDAGEKPSVISAIVKAYLTEGSRVCINDAMDIHAGAAICRGPSNIYTRPFNAIPVGITVEGANILTRSLIIFGQGVIRCHPFVLKEMEAAKTGDVRSFDQAFFGHIGHISKNIIRALLLGLSNGGIASSPVNGFEARYYRGINRFSAAFALISDVALGTLGDALKRKEYLSGRLSDAFSWMFLATAALKHFYDNGRPESERAMLDWTCTHAINEIETALLGVLANLPNRFASRVTKILTFPFGSRYSPLTDSQIDAVAEAITTNIEARNAVTAEIFIPGPDDPGLGALEHVFSRTLAAGPARNKLDQARREGKLAEDNVIAMTNDAVKEGILSEAEKTLIEEVEQLREAIIQVSDFDQVTYDQLK